MKNILLIALLLTISLSANAQIYKWVDDNGNIQYSQTPPMDRDAQVIRGDHTKGTPLTTEFSLKDKNVEGDIEVKDMKSESGEVSVIDTEKLKEYCAQQRQNLQVTENTKRMSVLGEDGKITNISDKDKEAKIQEIRANLQKYCQ